MRIRVYGDGAPRGIAHYVVEPEREKENGHPYPEDIKHLRGLMPRIVVMARRELEEDFIEVEDLLGMFVLNVKVGTSTRKRFELRALLGWIELFDDEP